MTITTCPLLVVCLFFFLGKELHFLVFMMSVKNDSSSMFLAGLVRRPGVLVCAILQLGSDTEWSYKSSHSGVVLTDSSCVERFLQPIPGLGDDDISR